ncbi:MAG TPA: hypothetical protein PK765_05890 [bacterium]|nr:hypothetical protein [bacterium]
MDFRGVPTYDTVYYLELAPMRSGQFTLGPVVVEDENGQIMQSDPISVVVAEAKTSLSDTDPENLISFSDSKKSVSTMEYALPVLGTLCLLLIALYATIALTSRRPPVTKSLCVSDSPPT